MKYPVLSIPFIIFPLLFRILLWSRIYIGAMFDFEIAIEKFVMSNNHSAMYLLRSIPQIRNFLDLNLELIMQILFNLMRTNRLFTVFN